MHKPQAPLSLALCDSECDRERRKRTNFVRHFVGTDKRHVAVFSDRVPNGNPVGEERVGWIGRVYCVRQ